MVEMTTGDRFSVVLPENWRVEESDTDAAYLFGSGEAGVFFDEADCASAQECQENGSAVFSGEVSQETVGGVTYYEHIGAVDGEHWYVDWNGRVYDITLSLIGPSVQDPSAVRSVVRSIEWLP